MLSPEYRRSPIAIDEIEALETDLMSAMSELTTDSRISRYARVSGTLSQNSLNPIWLGFPDSKLAANSDRTRYLQQQQHQFPLQPHACDSFRRSIIQAGADLSLRAGCQSFRVRGNDDPLDNHTTPTRQ